MILKKMQSTFLRDFCKKGVAIMSECIHVLHVIRAMDRGGAETMIMNLYRHIDRSRIKFDYDHGTDLYCTGA